MFVYTTSLLPSYPHYLNPPFSIFTIHISPPNPSPNTTQQPPLLLQLMSLRTRNLRMRILRRRQLTRIRLVRPQFRRRHPELRIRRRRTPLLLRYYPRRRHLGHRFLRLSPPPPENAETEEAQCEHASDHGARDPRFRTAAGGGFVVVVGRRVGVGGAGAAGAGGGGGVGEDGVGCACLVGDDEGGVLEVAVGETALEGGVEEDSYAAFV